MVLLLFVELSILMLETYCKTFELDFKDLAIELKVLARLIPIR